jgi:hypothetical protein
MRDGVISHVPMKKESDLRIANDMDPSYPHLTVFAFGVICLSMSKVDDDATTLFSFPV